MEKFIWFIYFKNIFFYRHTRFIFRHYAENVL